MKTKKLSDYLELMKEARDQEKYLEVKRIGEIAIKKLPLLAASLMEKHILYHRLGVANYRLILPSQALNAFYKAYLIASKHRFKAEYLANASYYLGSLFCLLNNTKQSLRYLLQVEEYYRKYGYKKSLMDVNTYVGTWIHLANCYLKKNELAKVRELINTKIPPYLSALTGPGLRLKNFYYQTKGDYLIEMHEYALARECFQQIIQLSRQEPLDSSEVHGKTVLAILAIIENRIDDAINILTNVLKEARRKRFDFHVCKISLLLSKCYRFKGLDNPDSPWNRQAEVLEKHIKTMVTRMDPLLFYEMSKDADGFYRHLVSQSGSAARKFSEILIKSGPVSNPVSYQEVIIGTSAVMQEVYYLVEKVAPTDLPVLIYGETGTGKELVARAVHQRSIRSRQTWLACNTGAIPETLLESELFGYVKGAFTGAQTDKKGYIELASNGTLFLDEIGSMSLGMQQKLLRVMEDNQLWRVGAETPVLANTRFVFASNEDLEELVKQKRFREDLYYRINTIIITLPPLRERKEDISLLVDYFIKKYAGKRYSFSIPDSTFSILANYPWPGNVRELENEIKRLTVYQPEADVITSEMLSKNIINETSSSAAVQTGSSFGQMKAEWEKKVIGETLRRCGGNITEASRLLHYPRMSLYRKIKQLKIVLPNEPAILPTSQFP